MGNRKQLTVWSGSVTRIFSQNFETSPCLSQRCYCRWSNGVRCWLSVRCWQCAPWKNELRRLSSTCRWDLPHRQVEWVNGWILKASQIRLNRLQKKYWSNVMQYNTRILSTHSHHFTHTHTPLHWNKTMYHLFTSLQPPYSVLLRCQAH